MVTSLLRRVRFRFGLKTLFVGVTLAALVLGWLAVQWRWVSQRNEARRQLDDSEVFSLVAVDRPDRLPWGLRLVRENAVGCVCVNKKLLPKDEIHFEELKQLFPEARPWWKPGTKKK